MPESFFILLAGGIMLAAAASDPHEVTLNWLRGLLANRPDYAYFHVGQPVEIDGSHFVFHAALGLPGVEKVAGRLARGEYSVVSEEPMFWPRGAFRTALDTQYRRVAVCGIGFFYGIHEYILHVPKEAEVTFAPSPGTRCRVVAAPGAP